MKVLYSADVQPKTKSKLSFYIIFAISVSCEPQAQFGRTGYGDMCKGSNPLSNGISVSVRNTRVFCRQRAGIAVSMVILLICLNFWLVILSAWFKSKKKTEIVACVGCLILYPMV